MSNPYAEIEAALDRRDVYESLMALPKTSVRGSVFLKTGEVVEVAMLTDTVRSYHQYTTAPYHTHYRSTALQQWEAIVADSAYYVCHSQRLGFHSGELVTQGPIVRRIRREDIVEYRYEVLT